MKTMKMLRAIILGLSLPAVLVGGLYSSFAPKPVQRDVARSSVSFIQVADGQETHGKTHG